MRIALAVIAATLLAGPALAWNEPDTFRGVPWGASQAELRAHLEQSGERVSCATPRVCGSAHVTIGPAIVPRISYHFPADDKFGMGVISFRTPDYASLRALFVERYGAPTNVREVPIQNRMGANITNEVVSWVGKRVVIHLRRYASKIDQGRAIISLRTAVEGDREDAQKAITEGEDDR